MSEVLIVSNEKTALKAVYGCLNLLSFPYWQLSPADLTNMPQREVEPRWLLLKLPGRSTDYASNCAYISDITVEQPLALLVDSNPRAAEAFALEQGCIGVLSLDMPADQMVKAITTLHNGGLWYSRFALEQLVRKQLQGRRSLQLADTLHTLTKKERLIAQLSAEGLENREIADNLHLSPNTVKTHMQRILRKTKVKNRTQLGVLFKHL